MKSIKTIFLSLAAAALVTTANAASYELTHLAGVDSYVKLYTGQSYSKTFTLPGFAVGSETVVWASLGFAFADDARGGVVDDDELVNVVYDFNFDDLGDVDGSHANPPTSYDWRFFTGVTGSLIVNALQDGMLNYTVTVTSGDTYLKEVKLLAESEFRRVPDGGSTVALLGAGLLGLIALKRRRR